MHDSTPSGTTTPPPPGRGLDPSVTPPSVHRGLNWTWVAIGVLLGIVLVSALVTIVEKEPPRPDVAILVGGLTFMLTGVLVGYRSPGETVAEATVAGGIVGIMTALVLTAGFHFEIGVGTLLAGWFAIVLLSTLGGGIGEVLQGTIASGDDELPGISWPWVAVGTVLGVVLNAYSVFVVNALFQPPGVVIIGSFLFSFVLAGAFVGYASPGVTILEPALAALLIVGIDAVLTLLVFRAPFPIMTLVIGSSLGFGLALLGGVIGERMQTFVDHHATTRLGHPHRI